MSMTKNSPHYQAMMEEAARLDENSHSEYLSEQYFRNRAKAKMPPKQPAKATKQQPHANDH